MNIFGKIASMLLFSSLVFTSGCFALGQKPDFSLHDLILNGDALPTCELQDPPTGDDLPCSFDTVPYYSEDPDFLACGMNLMGMNLGFLEQSSEDVKAMLLQAYLDPKQDHHEIGMYGVEFKSKQTSENFLKKIRPVIQAMQSESDAEPEIWAYDKVFVLIWNDAEADSLCFKSFKDKLQAAGLEKMAF